MIDVSNILRLAGDGYDVRDIRKFTRVPIPDIKQVCKDAGVKLESVTERVKPLVRVVKSPQADAENRYQVKMAAKYTNPQKDPQPPKVKQNPLGFAATWLGGRLKERPGAGYVIDGTPANLTQIMRAANAAAKRMGAEQLGYSESWLV